MNELERRARAVRDHAYAPYSRYHVGAALRADNGAIYVGCNVENASYGGTICAERSAIVAMIADGAKKWSELVVVTQDGGSPCGFCRQVLAEFAAPEAVVHVVAADGSSVKYPFSELFPFPFHLQT